MKSIFKSLSLAAAICAPALFAGCTEEEKPVVPAVDAGKDAVKIEADKKPEITPVAPIGDPVKPEAPKVDPIPVPVEAPKVEAPKVEAPKVEAPAEAPKVEAPKVEAPKVDAPKAKS